MMYGFTKLRNTKSWVKEEIIIAIRKYLEPNDNENIIHQNSYRVLGGKREFSALNNWGCMETGKGKMKSDLPNSGWRTP